MFDRTGGTSWQDKLFRRTERTGGAPVTVWGDVKRFSFERAQLQAPDQG